MTYKSLVVFMFFFFAISSQLHSAQVDTDGFVPFNNQTCTDCINQTNPSFKYFSVLVQVGDCWAEVEVRVTRYPNCTGDDRNMIDIGNINFNQANNACKDLLATTNGKRDIYLAAVKQVAFESHYMINDSTLPANSEVINIRTPACSIIDNLPHDPVNGVKPERLKGCDYCCRSEIQVNRGSSTFSTPTGPSANYYTNFVPTHKENEPCLGSECPSICDYRSFLQPATWWHNTGCEDLTNCYPEPMAFFTFTVGTCPFKVFYSMSNNCGPKAKIHRIITDRNGCSPFPNRDLILQTATMHVMSQLFMRYFLDSDGRRTGYDYDFAIQTYDCWSDVITSGYSSPMLAMVPCDETCCEVYYKWESSNLQVTPYNPPPSTGNCPTYFSNCTYLCYALNIKTTVLNAPKPQPKISFEINENKTEFEIDITPNPSDGSFTLTLPNLQNQTCKVQVLDMRGALMQETTSKINQNQMDLNCSVLSNGVYMIIVTTATGETYSKEFIIAK